MNHLLTLFDFERGPDMIASKTESGVTVYGKGDAKKFCEALGLLKH